MQTKLHYEDVLGELQVSLIVKVLILRSNEVVNYILLFINLKCNRRLDLNGKKKKVKNENI